MCPASALRALSQPVSSTAHDQIKDLLDDGFAQPHVGDEFAIEVSDYEELPILVWGGLNGDRLEDRCILYRLNRFETIERYNGTQRRLATYVRSASRGGR